MRRNPVAFIVTKPSTLLFANALTKNAVIGVCIAASKDTSTRSGNERVNAPVDHMTKKPPKTDKIYAKPTLNQM